MRASSSTLLAVMSGGFLPTNLPNLMAWYDAQDAGSFTFSTGADVSQWRDKSGKGNHMAQGTASAQPLYVASGVSSKPSVQFYDDSTFKQLACADNANLDYTALTVFVVAQRVTDLGAIEIMFGKYATTSNIREFYVGVSAADLATFTYSPDGTGSTAAATASGSIATGAPVIISADWLASNTTCKVNNANAGSNTATGIFNGAAPLVMGSINAGGNLPFSGHIGEVIAYSRSLSATEFAQVYSYLSAKWGI